MGAVYKMTATKRLLVGTQGILCRGRRLDKTDVLADYLGLELVERRCAT
jgi:hypothetical protein